MNFKRGCEYVLNGVAAVAPDSLYIKRRVPSALAVSSIQFKLVFKLSLVASSRFLSGELIKVELQEVLTYTCYSQ